MEPNPLLAGVSKSAENFPPLKMVPDELEPIRALFEDVERGV